jgi:hypothetical protein
MYYHEHIYLLMDKDRRYDGAYKSHLKPSQ